MLPANPNAWSQDVVLSLPNDNKLAVNKNGPTPVDLINKSARKLAFKIKTTRFEEIQPTKGMGVIEPHGGHLKFDVAYKPQGDNPLRTDDRLTILVKELPDGVKNMREFWKTPGASDAQRIVLYLTEAQSAKVQSKASSSGATTTTTEEESEESEEESESEGEE